MTDDCQKIADMLDRIRVADPDCRFFGVDTHRYRFGPCLTDNDLQSIEAHYGITLPDDYRRFLLEIGNGGAGPGYGLQRFGFVESADEIPTATANGPMRVVQTTRNGTLSRQNLYDDSGHEVDPMDISFFATIKPLARDGDSGPGIPSQPFPLSSPFDEWAEECDGDWSDIDPSIGTWNLADYGCAMSARLVLNGPFGGQVWFYDPNSGSFTPFNAKANIHYVEAEEVDPADLDSVFTFSAWYVHWLNHAIAQVPAEYEDAG